MVKGNVQRIAHSKSNSQSEEREHQNLLKRKVQTNLDVFFYNVNANLSQTQFFVEH